MCPTQMQLHDKEFPRFTLYKEQKNTLGPPSTEEGTQLITLHVGRDASPRNIWVHAYEL